MAKIIYNYSTVTGEFTGSSEADESPLEPGVSLLPAHSTDAPPPAVAANEVAVFFSGAWSVQPDFRGMVVYSTQDGSPVPITGIGPQPADTTDQERPSIYHDWSAVTGWVENTPRLKDAALASIDAEAGAARARYITVAPGQEATYMLKAEQARAYKAASYPSAAVADYPMVDAEAKAINGAAPTAAQIQTATDGIIAQADAWIAKASQIERARIGGKRAVTAALDVVGVEAARAAAVAELAAL